MASGQANAEVTTDGTSPTVTCLHEQPIVCMADDNANAAIDVDICGTLKLGGESSDYVLSNGDDIVGALCAADGPKGVGSQYFYQGKVICQRTLL